MLPFFGQVPRLDDDSHRFTTERPPASPSTSSALMQPELTEVRRTVDDLTREQLAIVHKSADGAGTYTPHARA